MALNRMFRYCGKRLSELRSVRGVFGYAYGITEFTLFEEVRNSKASGSQFFCQSSFREPMRVSGVTDVIANL